MSAPDAAIEKLPPGWVWTTLAEIADIKGGITLGKKRAPADVLRDVPYLRVANVQRGFLKLDEIKTVPATESEIRQLLLQDGDLLFNEGGDRDKLGRGWFWSCELHECIHQNHVFRARLRHPQISPKLVSLYTNTFGQTYFLNAGRQTTNLASINLTTLSKLPIPIAPANEQRRIVAKVESLLARSRRAKEALEAVPALLERFRQSVLASAFRGDLTRDWREKNPDVEPASKLLERIRVERRRRWEEAELEKMKVKGKVPKDDKWKSKYEEPSRTDDAGDLPRGWAWATIGEIAEDTTYGTSAKTDDDAEGVPVLRMGNIQDGLLDLADLKYLPSNHNEFPELLLSAGDILFNRTNSPELVGKSAVFTGVPARASFASYLLRVRLIECVAQVVSHYINSHHGRAWVASVVNQQVGQANVNGTKLRALVVPVPPRAEQRVMADRIDQSLRAARAVSQVVRDQIESVAALEQSLLAKAFLGKLVTQDLRDEPASVLLERIKAERVQQETLPAATRKKAPRASKLA